MYRLITFIVVYIIFTNLNAQTQGGLDSTFNGTGSVVLAPGIHNDIIYDLEIQTDGFILSTGVFMETGTFDFDVIVSRLRPEGVPDPGFGIGGYYKKDFGGFFDLAKTLKVTPDKKILVGGSAGISAAVTRFLVMRLTMNGQTDTTFGNGDGYVLINCGNADDIVHDITLQEDGKILCAGEARFPALNGTRVATLFRLESDGSLDTTFGISGFAKLQIDPAVSTDYFQTVALQPDGKIIAAGYSVKNFGWRAIVARFLANGSLDTTFNVTGIYQVSSGSFRYFYDMELDWPNRIILAGIFESGTYDAGLFALDFDGLPDPNFGQVFSTTILDFGGEDRFFQMDRQANGKIIAVGSTSNVAVTTRDFLACRFLSNGLPDSTFGVDGHAIFDLGTSDNFNSVDIQPDGKIVAGGIAGSGITDMAVLRFFGDNVNTGMEENAVNTLRLYPVPVRGNTINLNPGEKRTTEFRIQLYDILGAQIASWEYPADHSVTDISLKLPVLAPGTYLLHYRSESLVLSRAIVVGR
jgi:uncharacterized delta-60 repeat protein